MRRKMKVYTCSPVNMDSQKMSSSSELFWILQISGRVQGTFFRMRRISSVLINCCRIALINGEKLHYITSKYLRKILANPNFNKNRKYDARHPYKKYCYK